MSDGSRFLDGIEPGTTFAEDPFALLRIGSPPAPSLPAPFDALNGAGLAGPDGSHPLVRVPLPALVSRSSDAFDGGIEIAGPTRVGEGIEGTLRVTARRRIEARWLLAVDGRRAVVEMAEASGLSRLRPDERDPIGASSFGLGELVLAAARAGARELVVGIGGSATTDGGRGMLEALGMRGGAGARLDLDEIGRAHV